MSWAKAQEDSVPGGVSDHGMLEEDGPGTWEILTRSREGRSKARETEAETEGDRKSEGCIRATTMGNGR
jgi:hypothetical protein